MKYSDEAYAADIARRKVTKHDRESGRCITVGTFCRRTVSEWLFGVRGHGIE